MMLPQSLKQTTGILLWVSLTLIGMNYLLWRIEFSDIYFQAEKKDDHLKIDLDKDNNTAAAVTAWPIQHSNSSLTGNLDPPRDPVKTVVMWTYDTHFDNFKTDRHSDHFCNLTTTGGCLLTSNRSLYEEAAAIMFFPRHYAWPNNLTAPPKRFPWQFYVVHMYESAVHSAFRREHYMKVISPIISQPGFFNLTSTFRTDSDFPIPYLITEPLREPCSTCLPNTSELQKKRLLVWFVSHCSTQSRREEYAHALSKHIWLDRYGDCAQEVACGDHRTENCRNVSLQDYKFYFAAENALCKDYFTEKLFRPLDTFVVPVVYGGKDVHKVAPPHSYIDVRDFKSPKHLAQYLLYLDKNHAEYMSYFKWKENYKVTLGDIHSTTVFCQLCEYLFTNSTRKAYHSFNSWFFEESQCENPSSQRVFRSGSYR